MSQSRRPRGQSNGGQFTPDINPESSLILDEREPTGPPKMYGIIAALEKSRDEADEEYAQSDKKAQESAELDDIENASYSDGLRAGYDLALLAIRDADVYIARDGSYGSAKGLLLLSEADVEKIGDITELYDEWGDNVIDGVKERLDTWNDAHPDEESDDDDETEPDTSDDFPMSVEYDTSYEDGDYQ